MKKKVLLVATLVVSSLTLMAQQAFESKVTLMTPGNLSETHALTQGAGGQLTTGKNIPLKITRQESKVGNITTVKVKLQATDVAYYNYEEIAKLGDKHDDCLFYMPGFWYRKNLRSPKDAPSFHTSDSWRVREDRLSVPLTGVFNEKTGDFYTVVRQDEFKNESLATHSAGDVILTDKTSIGFTGFQNINGSSNLVYGFPYNEAPNTYIRKLTLAPAVRAFEKLEKGETRELTWQIQSGNSATYSTFVADTWNYCYDTYKPQKYDQPMATDVAKAYLTEYFVQSYVDKHPLKYFSGVHMRTDDCVSTGSVEVGFVGRVLLNAFNALEYAEQNNRPELVEMANNIFDSYLEHGFTPNGFFREFVDYTAGNETDVFSIRRQSEGVFAILNYLDYEKKQGRKHPEWEAKMVAILANFLKLQEADGSYPRKFKDNFELVDETGGSTPSATLPLTMAYKYFNKKEYLGSAKKTATYLEKEIISKADYFSSTLDANCEDKEASLYASTAMYYLSMVTKGKEREHYVDLSKTSAYFALSWYYMWDVPFAQGQMLGDVNFKSRGWGNVSVENNHVDVFIFEFATVLDWLAKERNEKRFSEFSDIIKSSMLQLMPREGHMFNIGKVGYYPEVVQHTNWDYGKNGKGFYNDIFAPGWTVASLWQMMSPDRVEDFFHPKKNKK